mgnify:CR=1 FL=1
MDSPSVGSGHLRQLFFLHATHECRRIEIETGRGRNGSGPQIFLWDIFPQCPIWMPAAAPSVCIAPVTSRKPEMIPDAATTDGRKKSALRNSRIGQSRHTDPAGGNRFMVVIQHVGRRVSWHMLSNAAARIVRFLRVNGPILPGVNSIDSFSISIMS